MDLRSQGHILYISSVDISKGNGPGVNERGFITALFDAIGDRAHFLIPRSEEEAVDLPASACTFYMSHRNHQPLAYLLHNLAQAFRARHLLAQRHFDLIVFRLDVLALGPLLISWRFNTPYAIKTLGQGGFAMLETRGRRFGGLMAKLNAWLVRRMVNNAIVTDACSQPRVEYLQRRLSVNDGKIRWIDNAVDMSHFTLVPRFEARRQIGLGEFDPIVGYVGSRPWERGGKHIVEAASKLRPKYPSLGVLVVGTGPDNDRLRALAEQHGIMDCCIFAGYVPFKNIAPYINAIDVGVSINSRPERFGSAELKVRQYLACGKPVVATAGANDFLLEEGLGSVVDAADPRAIEYELDHWLSLSEERRLTFEKRARQFADEQLSTRVTLAQRLELWSSLLKDSLHSI